MTTMEECIDADCRAIMEILDKISGIALPARVYRLVDQVSQRVANIQNTLGEGDPK